MSTMHARLKQPIPGWSHRGAIDGPEQGLFLNVADQATEFLVDGWTTEELRSPITISYTPSPGIELGATEGKEGTPVSINSDLEGTAVYHDGWWEAGSEPTAGLAWNTSRVHSITVTGPWGTVAVRAPRRVAETELSALVGDIALENS
jgi:hypothetical protein